MTKTDANPPMPEWSDEYQLVEVDADYLLKAVKPKQFIHIDHVNTLPWANIYASLAHDAFALVNEIGRAHV